MVVQAANRFQGKGKMHVGKISCTESETDLNAFLPEGHMVCNSQGTCYKNKKRLGLFYGKSVHLDPIGVYSQRLQ